MNRKRVIATGCNIVSPLGFTAEENFQAALSGRSGVTTHTGTFGIPEPFGASLFDRSVISGPDGGSHCLFESGMLSFAPASIRLPRAWLLSFPRSKAMSR